MENIFDILTEGDFLKMSLKTFRYQYENVEIYNLKTKKSIKLDKDAGRFVSISIYVGGRKMPGEPDLTPFLSRVYTNYDEDVYCLNANREMVVKKILKADR